MKRHINYIVGALLCSGMLAACADDDYTELDKSDPAEAELTLKASTDNIVLDEQAHSSDALELNWTTGTNYGTGNRIRYTLEIAKAGTQFAEPVRIVEAQTRTYSHTWSVEQLNDLLRSSFGTTDEPEELALEARVTADVAGNESLTQTSATAFTATTYKPVTTTLYLIGQAMPNGWSADNAEAMKRTDNGIFTWSGTMHVGEYKFITTLGSFYPQYVDDGNGSPVLRSGDDDPVQDRNFQITEEAEEGYEYKIDVNLLAGTLTVSQVAADQARFEELFFVGGMTNWGFEAMTMDVVDRNLFRLGRYIGPSTGGDYGEFKFGTQKGWDNMLMAETANAPYTSTGMAFGGEDRKWLLQDSECDKAYKICVDVREGKERMLMSEFTPYETIYLIGEAAPGGWSMDDAVAMTADASDPYTFTWTGTLGTGELKFTCDKQSDWMGAWFLASEDGKTPTGEEEQMLFIDKSSAACAAQYLDIAVGGIDQKWKIQEAGTYTITLNQLKETITIIKK